MQLVVLDGVDLVDEFRCGGSRLECRSAFTRVDQRNSGTVDPGNSMGSELGDLAQQLEHAAGAGHDPGQPAQPGVQVDFVRFPLGVGQFWPLWRFATRLRVVVGHGQQQMYRRSR
jgi:hypothetical protein